MTPPFKLLAYKNGNCGKNILQAFGENIFLKCKNISGITSEVEFAKMFLENWIALTNCEYSVDMNLRCYKLEKVNEYAKPQGSFRVANRDDFDVIVQYLIEFNEEVNQPVNTEKMKERTLHDLNKDRFYVWENNGIVSMAKKIRETKNGESIGSVYTPKELRGKGYATAVVAEISKKILLSGKTFCALYTDLSNPTSNNIYQKIGYKPAGDSISFGFIYNKTKG
jgi:predicted GNAT family acetyltransferase